MIITTNRLNGVNSIYNHFIVGIITAVMLFLPAIGFSDTLKPFTTDGCSSFPDGTLEQQSLWAQCCIRHDLAYWQGGSYAQRLAADQALESCVAEAGEPEIAKLMLTGVRVGGTPYLPTSFRWGYGWPWPRGYKTLTDQEKLSIKHELDNLQIMLKSLTDELKTQSN